jgi:hypothetical protein
MFTIQVSSKIVILFFNHKSLYLFMIIICKLKTPPFSLSNTLRLCSVVRVLIPRLIFSARGSSGSRTAHSILSVDNFHTDLIPCLIWCIRLDRELKFTQFSSFHCIYTIYIYTHNMVGNCKTLPTRVDTYSSHTIFNFNKLIKQCANTLCSHRTS